MNTKIEIEQKVKKIISKVLNMTDEIKLDASLMEDLGADSLHSVEISMTLEEEFGIEIPDDDIAKIATVKNIIDYVEQKINK